jgi:hypothetical protein
MRWAGHVAHIEERRGVYRFLVGKPKGRRPFVRPMSTAVITAQGSCWSGGCIYIETCTSTYNI